MKRTILPSIILFLIGSVALGAQETLTLEQARSKALANSRTLQSALLAVDSAKLTERLQSFDALPSVSASAGAALPYTSSGTGEASGSLGISLKQTVYDGGKTALLKAIDASASGIAGQEARAAYFSVLAAVDEAYFGTLRAQASLTAARSDLDAYKAHLDLAKAKRDAGVITAFELLQTEAETTSKETAVIQAEGALAAAQKSLETLTGTPASSLAEADPEYSGLMEKAAGYSSSDTAALIEALQAEAAAHNPSTEKSRLTEDQARKSEKLARAGYLPTLEAAASHSISFTPGTDPGIGSGSISLSASMSLDFWTVKTNVQAKRLDVKIAELDSRETLANLGLEVQSAVYAYVSSARQAASAGKALEYAEGYYASVLELYRLSAASSSDLSDAEALVSANRSSLISARYGFFSALSALRTLGGFETEQLLIERLP